MSSSQVATATIVSLCTLILLSLVQALGVPYVLLSGYSDTFLLAGEILIISGVSRSYCCSFGPSELAKEKIIQSTFSIMLAAFHLIVRRQLSRYNEEQCRKSNLGPAYTVILRLAFITWLAAGAIGLVVAKRHTMCAKNMFRTRPWNTIDSCKLQQASVVMSLLSM